MAAVLLAEQAGDGQAAAGASSGSSLLCSLYKPFTALSLVRLLTSSPEFQHLKVNKSQGSACFSDPGTVLHRSPFSPHSSLCFPRSFSVVLHVGSFSDVGMCEPSMVLHQTVLAHSPSSSSGEEHCTSWRWAWARNLRLPQSRLAAEAVSCMPAPVTPDASSVATACRSLNFRAVLCQRPPLLRLGGFPGNHAGRV